jgi:CRP-like cAMP-binding protein
MFKDIFNRKTYHPGQMIFEEGDASGRAFLVKPGKVEIFKRHDGEKIVLGAIGNHGIFGELSLIDEKPRQALAKALEDTARLVIPREFVEQKLAASEPFLRGLLRVFVRNVRSLTP